MDCHDSCKFLAEMAGAESESSSMSLYEPMEMINEMEERSLRIDSLYTPGTIYPETLPLVVLDKIMKYHRLANAEIVPRKFVNIELRRFNVYSKYLNRRLSTETMSPRFIRNLRLLVKISRYVAMMGDELNYLAEMLLQLVTGPVQHDEVGLNFEFRDLQ